MKFLIVFIAVVALCHGRALEEKMEPKKDLKDTIPAKDDKKKEPLATRAVLVEPANAFLLKHSLDHPDCAKTFPNRQELVEVVKEIPVAPIVKVTNLKEKVNIQEGQDLKTLIARDAEKQAPAASKDELANKETEKAKPKDDKLAMTTAAPTTTTAAPKIAREAEKPADKPELKAKTEEPKKEETKKSEEAKKPAEKVRRSIKEEMDMKKVEPTMTHLNKDDMKMIMKADKEDAKKRSRRSYGGSATRLLLDDDDDDDDFDNLRSSEHGFSFATRTLPALRASSYGGLAARSGYGRSLSFARGAPSGYGASLIREAPVHEFRSSGYGGGALVRDFDDDDDLDFGTRASAGYGKSLAFDSSDFRSTGYGGALIRETPELEIHSAGYGGASFVRDLPDHDFDTRAGYGKSLSFDSDLRSSGYGGLSLVREAPELEIRSSGYGGASLVRDLPDLDFNTRAGYGRSLSFDSDLRSSGYGGLSLVREAPELEIRSSGYGGASLVRDLPDHDFDTRAGYGKSLSFDSSDFRSAGYGGAALIREAPELEIRSSGYGATLVREAPELEFRSGYGKALKTEEEAAKPKTDAKEEAKDAGKSRSKRSLHKLFKAFAPEPQRVEVVREVPVVKEVIREVPVIQEVEVVREVPVVHEVEVVREVPFEVRSSGYGGSSFRSLPTRSRYGKSSRSFPRRSSYSSLSSDFSDLRESSDIPLVRSAYDDAPVRISFTESDFRSDSRYKRETAPVPAPAKSDSSVKPNAPATMPAAPSKMPKEPMM